MTCSRDVAGDGSSTAAPASYANSVIIQSGGSIKAAIASITDASASKPYTVLVYPGIYTEQNPIQGKANITVKAIGGQNTVDVVAANAGQNLFDGVGSFFLEDLTLKGVSGAGKYAFELLGTGACLLQNILFEDCVNGIHLNNAGGQLITRDSSFQGTMTTGIFVEAGNITSSNISVVGLATITTLINITGVNSIATLDHILSFSPNLTTCIFVQDQARVVVNTSSFVGMTDGVALEGGSTFRATGITIFNAQQDGLRINDVGSGTIFACQGCTLLDSTRYDLNFLSATCVATGTGSTSIDQMNFVAGAQLYGAIIDTKEDDEGVKIIGELQVGLPEKGSESTLGEGDSYTRGMLVYTENTSNVFVDVSVNARSASSSTFTYTGVAADNSIYIASSLPGASDVIEHYGIKTKVNTAAVKGAGEIVIEYWNGSTWAELNGMETDSSDQYLPHAKDYFQDLGSHHIRYDAYLATDNWTKNDPMSLGTDYYWTRFRIKTAITTAPVFEQYKLHTSRTEMNTDGWIELFGKARSAERFPWDAGLLEAAAASPANQDLYLSDNLDVGRTENKFANSATDRIGFLTPLPVTVDTSTPVRFRWAVITDDSSAGNINWVARWGFVSDGGSVFGSQADAPTTAPNEQSISQSLAAPTSDQVIKWYSIDLDISNMISRREPGFPDTLFVSLQRTAGDSHGGDVSLVAIDAFYFKWCTGGHV